jgi:hypothetical protein
MYLSVVAVTVRISPYKGSLFSGCSRLTIKGISISGIMPNEINSKIQLFQ